MPREVIEDSRDPFWRQIISPEAEGSLIWGAVHIPNRVVLSIIKGFFSSNPFFFLFVIPHTL